jgi:hypothetical protein
MAKLTRKQIKEGLDTVPMDTLLLGVKTSEALTPKQKQFARNIAMGKSKAQSYREAYNTKASPNVVGTDASKLSKHPMVALEIEAYREAIEAEKHRTPIQLRALVIHQLTKMALNDKVNDAQRIKSLELLGKVAEVGAFVDRKETTIINASSDIRARLMAQLKTITQGSITEVDDSADSLLEELSSPAPSDAIIDQATPTGEAPPQIDPLVRATYTHNVPHNESTSTSTSSETESQPVDSSGENNCTITSYSTPQEKAPLGVWNEEGVGVVKNSESDLGAATETPPVTNWKENG